MSGQHPELDRLAVYKHWLQLINQLTIIVGAIKLTGDHRVPRHVHSASNLIHRLGGEPLTLRPIAVRTIAVLLATFGPLLLAQDIAEAQEDTQILQSQHFLLTCNTDTD